MKIYRDIFDAESMYLNDNTRMLLKDMIEGDPQESYLAAQIFFEIFPGIDTGILEKIAGTEEVQVTEAYWANLRNSEYFGFRFSNGNTAVIEAARGYVIYRNPELKIEPDTAKISFPAAYFEEKIGFR